MEAMAELDSDDLTLSVVQAGKKLGIKSRSACYEAAKRNQIPTLRVGRCLRVPKAALAALLANPPKRER
jgi:excisionase family DNA binding protein